MHSVRFQIMSQGFWTVTVGLLGVLPAHAAAPVFAAVAGPGSSNLALCGMFALAGAAVRKFFKN
jgi:hypothetical protein